MRARLDCMLWVQRAKEEKVLTYVAGEWMCIRIVIVYQYRRRRGVRTMLGRGRQKQARSRTSQRRRSSR